MTKLKYFILLISVLLFQLPVLSQDLSYFLPEGEYTLNPEIPTPKQFLGFNPGEHHVSHDQLLFYMRELANRSSRIISMEIGTTYENRPLIFLIISSEENLAKIDKIREDQIKLTDPAL